MYRGVYMGWVRLNLVKFVIQLIQILMSWIHRPTHNFFVNVKQTRLFMS